MRILVVSPFFPPQPDIASTDVHALATAFARAGEDVTVLTTLKRPDQLGGATPDPSLRLIEVPYRGDPVGEWLRARHRPPSAVNREPANLDADATEPGRSPLARWRERSGVYSAIRMPDLTQGWVRPAVARALQEPRFDAVLASSGPFTALLAAWKIKQRGHARRFVAHYRDLWTDHLMYRGVFPFSTLERSLERRVRTAADLFAIVSPDYAEDFARVLPDAGARVRTCLTGFVASELAALDPAPAFPPGPAARIVHTGRVYPTHQHPAPFFEAVRLLRDADTLRRPIELVMPGPQGPMWRALAERASVADLLTITDRVDHRTALRMQRDASLLITFGFEHNSTRGVLPGKLYEYAAQTAPVLVIGGPADAPSVRLLERAGRGAHAGHTPEHIASAISHALTRPGPVLDRDFIAGLSRERQAQTLLDEIRRIV